MMQASQHHSFLVVSSRNQLQSKGWDSLAHDLLDNIEVMLDNSPNAHQYCDTTTKELAVCQLTLVSVAHKGHRNVERL